jgi:hypothetical protein
MPANLELIVPGLFNLPVHSLPSAFLEQQLPSINRFLRYARAVDNDLFDLDSILSNCMGWKNCPILPFAQALVDQAIPDKHRYLLCRAIHLKADMHNAIIVPLEENQVNETDIGLIINDVCEYFNVDCDIKPGPHGYWLMRLKQFDPPMHYPHYISVLGMKADPYIEQSKLKLPWYRLVNEIQMFMHQHAVNQDRQETGLLPINSIWFWGAGELPEQSTGPASWYCDDELIKCFASASSIACDDCTGLKQRVFQNDSLVIDLSVLHAMKTNVEVSLEVLLRHIEENLFEPLLEAVSRQGCNLRLRAGCRIDYAATPLSRFKWWSKPKNLITSSDYLADRG